MLNRFLQSLVIAGVLVFAMPSVPALSISVDDWVEYRSENFVVYSDGKPKDVRQLIADLETFRFVVLGITGLKPRSSHLPLKIIAFRSRRNFKQTLNG